MHDHSSLLFVIHWAVSAVSVLITSKVISGFRVQGFVAALVAAVIIGIANAFIWPVLIVITLPINILTLGLFTFVVNGAVLKICAALLPGFEIDSWGAAILGSLVLSVVGTLLHYIVV